MMQRAASRSGRAYCSRGAGSLMRRPNIARWPFARSRVTRAVTSSPAPRAGLTPPAVDARSLSSACPRVTAPGSKGRTGGGDSSASTRTAPGGTRTTRNVRERAAILKRCCVPIGELGANGKRFRRLGQGLASSPSERMEGPKSGGSPRSTRWRAAQRGGIGACVIGSKSIPGDYPGSATRRPCARSTARGRARRRRARPQRALYRGNARVGAQRGLTARALLVSAAPGAGGQMAGGDAGARAPGSRGVAMANSPHPGKGRETARVKPRVPESGHPIIRLWLSKRSPAQVESQPFCNRSCVSRLRVDIR